MLAKAGKSLLLCCIGGALYCGVELFWRGFTHGSMFLLAALLSLPLDQINEHLAWDRPFWLQALLGGVGITVAELLAGLVLNLWLGLGVWDYSALPWNLWGQICLGYSALWVALAGFGIVLFDWLRCWLFGERRPRYSWCLWRRGK